MMKIKKNILKTNLIKYISPILTLVLTIVLHAQCTKIGSKSILTTGEIDWYVSKNAKSSKDALQTISNIVISSLHHKGIDAEEFNVDIILCNSTTEFFLKGVLLDEKTQAITRNLSRNVVINRSDIYENKMDGNNNTLSEIIIHELCHIYLSKRLSLLDYTFFLETWKNEGFCEYISEHSTLDIEKGLSWFMTNNKAEIEKTDHDKILYFYFISRLKTDYLLRYKKVSFDEFINTKYNEELLDEEIRTALKNEKYKFHVNG